MTQGTMDIAAPESRPDIAGIRGAIMGFVTSLAPDAATQTITDDTSLLESGLLDSLGILELTTFLSERYGIEIEDEDFTADNFSTIGRLAAFIESKAARA